jgi:GNAT superfamily N-acetyltransferase
MNIRLANKNDVEELVEFNQAMAMETERKQLDPQVLRPGVMAVFDDTGKGFYVVTEADSRIVGGLLVTFEWSDWRNGWFWWIQSVYVLPEFRGRSVYPAMYKFIKRLADENGNVCGFRLYVEKENETARRVYDKAGMIETYYRMYEEEK